MDIPPITIAPASAPGIVTPVTTSQVPAGAPAQAAAALLAQTTVDLSPLGRFLSAVTLFQKRMLELQSNPAAAAAERASEEEGISPLASTLSALAESANALQASSLMGTSDDQSLATLFGQQFAAQAGPDGDADSADLAAIGLTFTSASGLEEGDVLNVDTAVLQAAFADDPAGTAALLARAGSAFAALAGIAPGADADPTAVLVDEPSPFDLRTQPAPQQSQDLPDFASPAPAPLSNDAAFFQELLAETPRPPLTLVQAPPPAVTEAAANFAAQRALAPDEAARAGEAPDRSPATLPPIPPPNSPDLPQTASDVASSASARTDVQPADFGQRPSLPAQAAAQAARTQADQALAAQDAARNANMRMADTIAAERDANERIANAMSAERAAQAADTDTRDIDEAALARSAEQNVEQRRLARDGEQIRLDRAREASELEANEPELTAPRGRRVAPVVSAPGMQADQAVEAVVPRPLTQPLNNAQQLARDPAIAAAIAAYNLSTGPFAALNGKAENAAPRPKVITPVESVTKIAAIETDAATSESSRPFR